MNPLVLTLNEKFCIMILHRVEINPLVLTLNEKLCIMILQRVAVSLKLTRWILDNNYRSL